MRQTGARAGLPGVAGRAGLRRAPLRCTANLHGHDDELHATKLGPNVITKVGARGVAELQAGHRGFGPTHTPGTDWPQVKEFREPGAIKWTSTTVLRK
jgi:hypothetical protein